MVTRTFSIPSLVFVALILGSAPGHAEEVVSCGVEAGQPSTETYAGTTVRPADAVDLLDATLVFDAFPDSPIEDIDALHVLDNGNVVFSTSTDVTQGFAGLASFKNGDLVEYDPGSDMATLFFDETLFGDDQNVDAFSILPNGNYLISTSATATLGGLTFLNGDVVEYDPGEDEAMLYMGLDEATVFTGANQNIDALHAREDGNLVLSLAIDGSGSIGSLDYVLADEISKDLVQLDPNDLDAFVRREGMGLFDGATRILDAVYMPPDEDGDDVRDVDDNCLEVPNADQIDSNMEGYGNACDTDYDDNDVVGGSDFIALSSNTGTVPPADEIYDATGDGLVGGPEFILLSIQYGGPPGPSGLDCAGTSPCPAP